MLTEASLHRHLTVQEGSLYYYTGESIVQYHMQSGEHEYLCSDMFCDYKNTYGCCFYNYDRNYQFYLGKDCIVYMQNSYERAEAQREILYHDLGDHSVNVLHTLTGNTFISGTDMIMTAPIAQPTEMTCVAPLGECVTLDAARGVFYALDKDTGRIFRSSSPGERKYLDGLQDIDYFTMTDGYF